MTRLSAPKHVPFILLIAWTSQIVAVAIVGPPYTQQSLDEYHHRLVAWLCCSPGFVCFHFSCYVFSFGSPGLTNLHTYIYNMQPSYMANLKSTMTWSIQSNKSIETHLLAHNLVSCHSPLDQLNSIKVSIQHDVAPSIAQSWNNRHWSLLVAASGVT